VGALIVYIRTARGLHYAVSEHGACLGVYRQMGRFAEACIRRRAGAAVDLRVI
jgi:hypothetical protein